MAFAADDKVAENILNDLKLINAVIAETPDFTIVLNHPSVKGEDKKQLLVGLFEGKVEELTVRLLGLLADKRRLDLLSHIEHEYLALLMARKSIVSASLTSAEPLADAAVSSIKAKLIEELGKQLELNVKVDQSLIGGLILRVGDQVLDGSLKGKLQVLERSLLTV